MKSLIIFTLFTTLCLAQGFGFFGNENDNRERLPREAQTRTFQIQAPNIGEWFEGLRQSNREARRREEQRREQRRLERLAAADRAGIDYKHNNDYMYGICLHKVRTFIASEIRPDLSTDEIEEQLISHELTKHDEVVSVKDGICGSLQTIENLYGGLNQLNILTDDMRSILDNLRRQEFRERVLDQAYQLAQECQAQEEAIHNTALEASTKVYEDNQKPQGWNLIESIDEPRTGFYAEILEEAGVDNGKIMLVVRGTNETKDWTDANVNYGFNQFVSNEEGIKDHAYVMGKLRPYISTGREIIFTGHSLGGGLAQAYSYYTNRMIDENNLDVSLKKNLRTITFGAFGGGPLIQQINDNSPPPLIRQENAFNDENGYFSLNQTHYRYNGDPVADLGYFPFGQRRTLYHNDSIDPEYKGLESVENHMLARYREWKRAGNTLSNAFPDSEADIIQTRDRLGMVFAGLTSNDAEIKYAMDDTGESVGETLI